MKRQKSTDHQPQLTLTNPFDLLTEEIVFAILDNIEDDSFAIKSFSATSKTCYSIESRHRRTLKPLRTELLPTTSHRYPSISHLDFTLCPRVDDSALSTFSSTWKSTLRYVNLSRSRSFSSKGLSDLFNNCPCLVELDLSNGTELTDAAAATIAEAKNLEKLWLTRCKKITDIGIGCIAVGCRKLRFLCLKWCVRLSDLGVGLVALKCKQLTSLDLSYLPITEKCLSSVLQLKYLEDLVLDGCHGIDDDGLATLQHSCMSLKTLSLANCQNVDHVGLSSLTYGAEGLERLNFAYNSALSPRVKKITADISACLHNFLNLQSINLDGCLVTCSGLKAIGNWSSSLKELSLSKCTGVTDEGLSILVQAQKDIRKLDITCCRKITYASIDIITSSCAALTSLRMEACSSVSKEAFVLIGQRCCYLEELDVTDNEIDNQGLKSISNCARLCSLKLGVCCNINDEGLGYIARGCSMLKELDLYRPAQITDIGITEIAHYCPSLETINIAYSDKVTDASLISLTKCLRLKELEIRGCSCVSSVGLSAIAMKCRSLTVLDIKKCVNINDNGMFPLAQFSHNLKQINLSYCSVTDVGIVALTSLKCLQNMTLLHVSGLSPNGLAAALLACRGLTKVKLHSSFKSLVPQSFLGFMESRGCVFHWRNKPFQAAMDPKGWRLHFGKETRVANSFGQQ